MTVVIDLGDVACHFRPAQRLERLVAVTGLDRDEIRRRWWDSGLELAAESGRLGPDVYPAVRQALATDASDDQLRAAWSLAFVPDGAVLEVVAAVTQPTVLFTNNGPIVSDCLDHELVGVRDRFDVAVCSWQIGHRKPAPAAFIALAERLGVVADQLVLVDDSQTNVDGARAAGLDGLRFTTPGALRAALAGRRLLAT